MSESSDWVRIASEEDPLITGEGDLFFGAPGDLLNEAVFEERSKTDFTNITQYPANPDSKHLIRQAQKRIDYAYAMATPPVVNEPTPEELSEDFRRLVGYPSAKPNLELEQNTVGDIYTSESLNEFSEFIRNPYRFSNHRVDESLIEESNGDYDQMVNRIMNRSKSSKDFETGEMSVPKDLHPKEAMLLHNLLSPVEGQMEKIRRECSLSTMTKKDLPESFQKSELLIDNTNGGVYASNYDNCKDYFSVSNDLVVRSIENEDLYESEDDLYSDASSDTVEVEKETVEVEKETVEVEKETVELKKEIVEEKEKEDPRIEIAMKILEMNDRILRALGI